MRYKGLYLLYISAILPLFSFSQSDIILKIFNVPYDTNYISTYTSDYTTRLYGSVKYGNISYNDDLIGKRLAYRPNNKLLLGIGVNHGMLGLNIGINFPFVNKDDEKYGETDYYDFTMRIFAPRFNATVYLQNYRGFYLSNTKDMMPGWQQGDPYYIRGDIRSRTVGLELSYIFNSSRFSYRAAILQNEWQKKSSGSFLVGGSIFYNANIGDSSIVPSNLHYDLFFDGLKFNRSNNFSIGPLAGYAYTFVIKRHFFIVGSVNGSVNIGFTQLLLVDDENKVKSGLVLGLRSDVLFSAGYNSDRWYFGFSFINLSIGTQAPVEDRSISYDTGMYRFNLVRRFGAKKPIKILNPGITR